MKLLYQQLQPKFVICEPEVAQGSSRSLKALNNDAAVFIIDADAVSSFSLVIFTT